MPIISPSAQVSKNFAVLCFTMLSIVFIELELCDQCAVALRITGSHMAALFCFARTSERYKRRGCLGESEKRKMRREHIMCVA